MNWEHEYVDPSEGMDSLICNICREELDPESEDFISEILCPSCFEYEVFL